MIKMTMFCAPEGAAAAATTEGAKGTTGAPALSITGEPAKPAGEPGKSLVDGQGGTGTAGKPGEGKPEGDKAPAADLKLKLPEGMDEKIAEPYLQAAKKHGLKGEAAQEFFDLALKAGTESRTTYEQEISSNAAKMKDEWLAAARKDPEIGGDKFEASVALANKAVLKFGGEELMDALIKTGFGKFPAVIRAFARAGAAITEDSIEGTTGAKGGGEPKSKKAQLKAEFPNSPGMWEHLPD